MYKHRIVQGLDELITKYGGKGSDPFMRAVWFGIKGQVPLILSTLDNSEEAIAEIEAKLREVLGIEEAEPTELPTGEFRTEPTVESLKSTETGLDIKVKKAPLKKAKRKKAEPVAEVEVVVEPAAEETSSNPSKPSI